MAQALRSLEIIKVIAQINTMSGIEMILKQKTLF
jgi:hypothetical protein